MASERKRWASTAGLILSFAIGAVRADDAEQRQFFETKIRPLLVEKCQSCHVGDSAESKFRVDSLEGLIEGGTRGPGIIPGKPAESLLISAVKHGEVLKMPPKEKLPASQIADLTKWIETGAYWPDAAPVTVTPKKPPFEEPEFPAEQRNFWAFQTPRRPAIPEATRAGEFRSPIDRFIDADLAAAGYAPAAPATKRILLRRATFDLIGLPPTPDDISAFQSDDSPDALERQLDRLLASPHYGIKWGRHWLDLARYADSNGLDENLHFGQAYKYRDYVVAAFNKDKPYDEFVREQIAGDLQNASDPREPYESLIATGFLAIGPKMLAEDDPVKMQMDIVDEQVDTLGKAFLGMTIGCARCHHHKFDPISTHDYYALAGILKSTKTMDTLTVVARWQERPLASPEQLQDLSQRKEQIAAKQSQIQQLVAATNEAVQTEARRHFGDYLLLAAQQEREERRLTERQPLGSQPDLATRLDVVVVEAENYARGNVLKDSTNYGKEIGVLVNAGATPNFAEYDLDIPQTGRYQIELRYAAAGARPCRLLVNSKELKGDAAGKITGGWMPEHQAWHIVGVYELPAGKIVVRLEQPTFFPHIDKLLIAPNPDGLAPPAVAKLNSAFVPEARFVQQLQVHVSTKAADDDPVFGDWRQAVREYCLASADQAPQQLDALKQSATKFQQRADVLLDAGKESPSGDALHKTLFAADGPLALPKDQEIGYPAETTAQLKQWRDEKAALEAALPKYPEAMAVSDSSPEDVRIHHRGSHLTLGDVVPRRFPRMLAGAGIDIGSQGSGRLELSDWLTRPDHPLTARVMVNRLWTWHFGQGLVRSVDNFGLLGELPTHPQLLDWLATEFPRRDWSLKQIHRELMGSTLYRRSGEVDASQREHDPENRLWGRYSRRRMQIEELRDTILATAGTLDDRLEGTHLTTANRAYVTSTANVNPDVYRITRRSIYLPIVRSALYEVLQAFDFADPNVSNGQRQTTTVAPQALFLMNSDFVAQQTLAWADAALAQRDMPNESRLKALYRTALGREPLPEEAARATQFLTEYAADVAATTSSAEGERRAWQSLFRALLSTNENVFVE